MLRQMLNGHPEILCHGEVFRKRMFTRFYQWIALTHLEGKIGAEIKLDQPGFKYIERLLQRNPAEFIHQVLYSSHNNEIKAIGFKFKTDEYFDPLFSDLAKEIKKDTTISVIHLKRKNLLAQYISHELVRRGMSVTFAQSKAPHTKTKAIHVNISHLDTYFHTMLYREQEIEKELSAHRIHVLYYEQLISDTTKVTDALLEYLSITPCKLKGKTVQLHKDHSSLIINKKEVLSFLQGSPFGGRYSL